MADNDKESTGASQCARPSEEEHTDPRILFDALNGSYSEAYESNSAQRLCSQNLISKLPPGARILDIGSGTGCPTASMLTEAGMVVTGIDISSSMVETARINVPRANFQMSDMRAYRPPGDKKFDAVIAIFSLILLPTSAIREMAFKMAHWLEPGGLLLLGTIDFTDVPKAEGYPEDPHHEWLSHHFMGRVIKDNVFGVGQWISLLRSADVSLIEAQGSIFDAEKSGIVVEHECFFFGRKGEKDALAGPYPSPYQIDGLKYQYTLLDIERQVLQNSELMETLLGHTQPVRYVSGGDISAANKSSTNLKDQGVYSSIIATHLLDASNDIGRSLSQLSSLLDRDAIEGTIALIEPAPFNDTVYMLNEVADFFNCRRVHYGALLSKAVTLLRQLGFKSFQIVPIGDEYIDFSSMADSVGAAVKLLRNAFTAGNVHGEAIEIALRAQVHRYFENQKHLGGSHQRIGFQRVALKASRHNVTTAPDLVAGSLDS
ncbi:MAG: hypothetical protein Q9198_001607 [Flavoplaca austrocitrina]